MQQNTSKPKRGKLPLIIIAIVLVLGIGAGVGIVLSGALDGTFGTAKGPAEALILEGDIYAVDVAAHGGDTTEEGFNEYFNGALNYAAQNGFNTIIYNAKPEDTVFWRDKTFTMDGAVTQDDSLFNKSFDPLGLLLEKARMSNIQVWVRVNTGLAFKAEDDEFVKEVRKGLGHLPKNYGIAGVLLDGLGVDTDAVSPVVNDIIADFEDYPAGVAVTMDSEAAAIALQGAVSADFTLLEVTAEAGYVDRLDALGAAGSYVLAQPGGSDDARVLFAAADKSGYHGAVLSAYPEGQRAADSVQMLRGATQAVEGVKPTGYTMPAKLEVTNPSYGYGTTSNKIYIVGTSDPAQPLYMDGKEVTNRTETGIFGVLVEMELGENTWEFSQDGETVKYLAKYHVPGGDGGDAATDAGGSAAPEFTTREAEAGEAVRFAFQFVTAYEEWNDTSVPSEMFYENSVAKLQNVLLRNEIPYAYQLTGGDWVYASFAPYGEAVALVEEVEWSDITFTGLTAREVDGGEYIDFTGSGMPAAYVSYKEDTNALEISMYDVVFSLEDGFSSRLVQSAQTHVDEETGATVLTLRLNEIWGYQLEYVDGGTTLYLKNPLPQNTGAKPLEGVTIMLDPGHGDQDFGAWAGIVGNESSLEGPYEKDLVLSLAQATAYRLRQLGAEVVMTRDDDSFMELYDRLAYQNEVKPDFFVSFHTNSVDPYSELTEIGGTEVYYYHPYTVANSKGLAENLVSSLVNETGFKNRGVKWSTYVVTRTTVCPSVLCEFGFLGNPVEFEAMISQEAIYNQAVATVQAILATAGGQAVERTAAADGAEQAG